MSDRPPPLGGFKAVFTTLGVVYVLLASSMLARGAEAMREFAVPASVVSAPAFADFFSFFFLLMAVIGVLMVLFGQVTRERRDQLLVASLFTMLNVVLTLRDLSTSDSSLGNRLYRGAGTLIPVFIDLAAALAFGTLALAALRHPRERSER